MTHRQAKLATLIPQYGGNMRQAMLAAGYAPSTAKTPTNVTKSRSLATVIDSYLPDFSAIIAHRQLLDAVKIRVYTFPLSYTRKEIEDVFRDSQARIMSCRKRKSSWKIFVEEPDWRMRVRALDLAYRIKGKYLC